MNLKRKRFLSWLIISLFILSFINPGMASIAGAAVPPPEPYGSISGTVTDFDTGYPLENVEVTAYHIIEWDEYYEEPLVWDEFLTYTDFDGYYYFESLPAGDYVIGYLLSGYHDFFTSFDGIVYLLDQDVLELNQVLEAHSASPDGSISGFVTDLDTEAPIQGVEVYIWGNDYESWTYTDENGYYLLENVPAGIHDVDFWHEEYASFIEYGVFVEEGLNAKVDVYLSPYYYEEGETWGSISGTVTDSVTEALIQGVEVCIWGNDYESWTYTDENGYYFLENVPAGNHYVDFWHEDYIEFYDYVQVIEGEALEVNVALQLITTEPLRPGDIDGDRAVNVTDAILLQRHIVNLIDIEDFGTDALERADVSNNGVIDISDAVLILRYVVALIDSFPVETGISWEMENNAVISLGEMYLYNDTLRLPVSIDGSFYGSQVDIEYDNTKILASRVINSYDDDFINGLDGLSVTNHLKSDNLVGLTYADHSLTNYYGIMWTIEFDMLDIESGDILSFTIHDDVTGTMEEITITMPHIATYQKGTYENVDIPITSDGRNFLALSDDKQELVYGEDYLISEDIYSILVDYLESKELGTFELVFEMDEGDPVIATVTIVPGNAVVSPEEVAYIRGSGQDIDFTITPNGRSLQKIIAGGFYDDYGDGSGSAEPGGKYVSIDNVYGEPGDIVTVNFQASGFDVTGFQFKVVYDPQVIVPVNARSLVPPSEYNLFDFNLSYGEIEVAVAYARSVEVFVGDLFSIDFQIVGDVGLTSEIIIDGTDEYNQIVGSEEEHIVTYFSGSVTVGYPEGVFELIEGQDYTVSGDTYTILASSLEELAGMDCRELWLTFIMDGGVNPEAVIVFTEEGLPLKEELPITGFYVLSETGSYYIDIHSYVENLFNERNIVGGAMPSDVMLVHQNGTATTLADGNFVALTEIDFARFIGATYTNLKRGEYFILSLDGNGIADAPLIETAGIESVYVLCGDASGDGNLSVQDAILILRHIVGLAELDSSAIQRIVTGDITGLSVKDAIIILRRVVGLEEQVYRLL